MIRYQKLGYVELNVTDLDVSTRFYKEIVGLDHVETIGGERALFRCDPQEPYSIVLHQAKTAGFKRVGWMLENDAQFAVLHATLEQHAVPYEVLTALSCSERRLQRVTRIVEKHSTATVEFYLPQPACAVCEPVVQSHTEIQRLGHVVFSTPQKVESVAFFRDVLNFKESDSIGEGVTFLRPFPSPWHHGMGVGKGARPLFHHVNFMVTQIDDIGKALNRFRRNDVPIVFGPGRHVASGSVFLYFLDPDGMTLEYSFGMEEFPEDLARVARVLPPVPESVDTWGAVRDSRMASAGEIEQAVTLAAETS